MAEEDDIHFSRLEASFVKTKVMPRANSIEMKDTNRHTQAGDAEARDLEFDFGLDRSHYPLDDLQSLQDVFSAVQHEAHAKNTRNFSDQTRIECLDANADSTTWRKLDSAPLSDLLKTRWETDSEGNLLACDFFCQQPRWNLHYQGAPVSVYVRYNVTLNLTAYIISHKMADTSIEALHEILNLAVRAASPNRKTLALLQDPFDIAVILSTLSFEASKHHVARFRRFMWTQINKVDDHLAGLETNDRRKLGALTKEIQVISQNADSHLINADVAIITATAIRKAHARLHEAIASPARIHERASDSITYVIESMEKQKIWFLNYKNRKDSTMALVYNLVTQQDAASNIQLAASMKQDSTSMNGIAALTMVFLPGTFIATILDAGILSTGSDGHSIEVSWVWWLWAAITIPLTLIVLASWRFYKKRKATVRSAPAPEDADEDAARSTIDSWRARRLSSWSRRESVATKV
ncbi:uncharacterized protein ACLA_017450 [Aspergillus clavatus NRRL 1]|uniref:CorA family metal ion transporter n=1 Tax=Aspergillus clavatus (strain ATCC 1007 / CBS 513.65 / DSM 816 / NCTC 3887 / NRRL 1 / QM 1276 / 107) TaxID=344612 RepID=A1CC30_ASPCL|nr:uncharacterized protein ACLA_017450 [Aspergillus clavatus NRRL 1]EAW13298.1 conserved hypothetical protein [Aspergillus clavatus NRRL 1]